MTRILARTIAGLALAAVAGAPVLGDDSEMYALASALTKLTAAVEAAVFEAPEDQTEDADLLAAATRHDSRLLARFRGYALHAKRDNGHALVLVCSPDGRVGLLEDAGCSAKLDAHLWKATPSKSCAFTLTAASACGVPKAPDDDG